LMLRLEGDFQSFGTQGKWYIRETDPEPSKSAIIGMIGNAMGLKKFDQKLEALDDSLEMAVRIEYQGVIMEDYHTVEAGSRSANRKFSLNPLLTTRTYLQNASFLVVLKSKKNDKAELQAIADALQNPKRAIFIGRKCCIPTRPIFQKIIEEYSSMEEAIKNEPWESSFTKNMPKLLSATIEDSAGELLRQDRFKCSPSEAKGYRNVRQINVPNPSLLHTNAAVSSEKGSALHQSTQ